MHDGTEPGFASSPCYLHEFESTDLIARLNELAVLARAARDEGRFCAMLSKHVLRLGGTPSPGTGASLDTAASRETATDGQPLLVRRQRLVVRALDELLQQPLDLALRGDLEEMRSVYRQNIKRRSRAAASRTPSSQFR